ncbi:SixA phosphatase family protein [Mucilaginibacter arboris]|uniref:Phosphohistidine phosphatase n=1 Tax=Mucilaginibacter arboris TaxID=2682090 RepID=A0A7K1SY99_9SPHI|nr:histidine phosphatase family protein [Mucilaginibacter arboris]MVN22296.1 phosphohistidine phosphatase [Mucilaginibacter arboris]
MKKLILIRHAEAESILESLTDFDRPLTSKGKQDAAQMAAFLLNSGNLPQITITSPAVRALATAHIFTATLGLDDAVINAKIYEANVDALLQLLNRLEDQYETACLVGHNPGISNLLYFLTGKITTIPTAAWAEVELEADRWAEVSSGTGKMLQYKYT